MFITPLEPVEPGFFRVLGKFEQFNVSGSHKDRPARLITKAIRSSGQLRPGSRLLVPSSGNFAAAIAHHTIDDESEVIVVTDVLSPVEFRSLLRRFHHVRLEVVDEPDTTGSHLPARLRRLDQLQQEFPDAIKVDQYADRRLPLAYESTLGPEIEAQTHGQVAAVAVPTGTGAMLNGLLKYVRKNNLKWKIIAADASGSRLFHQPEEGVRRHFSGYGNAYPTGLIREVGVAPYHYFIAHVHDGETASMCHRLWRRDRLLLGPSAGAALAAVEKVWTFRPDLIPDYGHVVAVLPDSGRNYLSTLYDDDWLIANGLGRVVSARI